ncbi:MAG: hypothetical protein AABX51_08535 [Nanoarchaeota archaeon]
MDKIKIAKKAQVTLFVILAIVIVAGILVYYIWLRPTMIQPVGEKLKLEVCVDDVVKEALDKLGKQGGYSNPDFFYLYQDNKVGYLCYTNLYYKPCDAQKPMLRAHVEEQLKKDIAEKVQTCYDTSIQDLQSKGYDVTGKERPDLKVSVVEDSIAVEIDAPVVIKKDEATKRFTKFTIKTSSRIYDLLMIATSIMQAEMQYGDSDTATMMDFYPETLIDKFKQDDGSTIYVLENSESKEKFYFAVRSLVFPVGYGFDSPEGFE